MNYSINPRPHERGAVSLFVVIFATLLIAVVTVGFIQLMLHNQRQASDSDLSQSALDSARAGVEDAKRLLLLNQACKAGTSPHSATECAKYAAAIANVSDKCTTNSDADLVTQTGDEVIVQQTAGGGNDAVLNQAYTCVKVTLDTEDYKTSLLSNVSKLVPIRGISDFNKVQIEWYSDKDLQKSGTGPVTFYTGSSDPIALPPNTTANWPASTPAVLRASLISTQGSFTFDDLNNDPAHASTLFMYPTAAGLSAANFAVDSRSRSTTEQPQPITCTTTVTPGSYACKALVDLPATVSANTDAVLRLMALYNASDVRVKLFNGASQVDFAGVEPLVDSTGRASDLFRRVSARIDLSGYFPYPEGVEVTKNFCKDFTVTDSTFDAGACDPNGP